MKHIAVALISLLLISTVSAFAFFGFVGDIEVSSPFDQDTFVTSIGAACTTFPIYGITNYANDSILVELVTSGHGTANITYVDEDKLPLSDLDDDGNPELLIPVGGTNIYVGSNVEPVVVITVLTTPINVDFAGLTSKSLIIPNGGYTPNYDMSGYVIYEESATEFNFCVKAEDLQTSEYGLIYYVDQSDRFVSGYGGVYPSKTIVTLTAGAPYDTYTVPSNKVFTIDSVELGHSLPHEVDANAYTVDHDYRGAPEFYADATGAKLWLIPTVSLNDDPDDGTTEKIMKNWAPSTFLLADGLVNYEDTGVEEIVPDMSTLTFTAYYGPPPALTQHTTVMKYYEEGDEFYYELSSTNFGNDDFKLWFVNFNTEWSGETTLVTFTGPGPISGSVNLDENLVNSNFGIQSLTDTNSYFISDDWLNYTDTDALQTLSFTEVWSDAIHDGSGKLELQYFNRSTEFYYNITSTDLDANINYDLAYCTGTSYYPITSFTADVNGKVSVSGYANIGVDLTDNLLLIIAPFHVHTFRADNTINYDDTND